MAFQSFEDLDVWKRACRLSVQIYGVLSECRDLGLKSQMTRAAVSVASNIAEGAERGSPRDFARFLNIAKGSTAELRTQVYIAEQIGVLNRAQQVALTRELKALSSMLRALTKSILKT